MSVVGLRVTVASSPTNVMGLNSHHAGCASTGSILNLGPRDVDLGGPEVLTGQGYPLTVGSAIDVDLILIDQLYAVTATGTSVLAVLKLRQ